MFGCDWYLALRSSFTVIRGGISRVHSFKRYAGCCVSTSLVPSLTTQVVTDWSNASIAPWPHSYGATLRSTRKSGTCMFQFWCVHSPSVHWIHAKLPNVGSRGEDACGSDLPKLPRSRLGCPRVCARHAGLFRRQLRDGSGEAAAGCGATEEDAWHPNSSQGIQDWWRSIEEGAEAHKVNNAVVRVLHHPESSLPTASTRLQTGRKPTSCTMISWSRAITKTFHVGRSNSVTN